MNKQELIDICRNHLRLSIACTLNIKVEDYLKSLDIRTAVNQLLTNTMALGYNEKFTDALKEILEYRYFNQSLQNDEFNSVLEELKATNNTLQREISAYRFVHKSYSEGLPSEKILEKMKALTPLKTEYKDLH